jgi:hypothetical protein
MQHTLKEIYTRLWSGSQKGSNILRGLSIDERVCEGVNWIELAQDRALGSLL